MLKTISLFALALVIAIGGGAWSVLYALNHSASFGTVTIGSWIAYPQLGTADADPYMQARYARDGRLALGRAEGIAFRAFSDAAGARLSRRCNYLIEGVTPPARFWTLHASDQNGMPLDGIGPRKPATSSLAILRASDNSAFSVALGPEPAPGNWLPLSGDGPLEIVLTLYDTPLANRTSVSDSILPTIRRVACDG